MRRHVGLILLLLLLAVPMARAQQDIRFDPDYDPRIELRVVVLPAIKDRALRRVSERTISALFATELLRIYEVLDLDRFEQFLADRELTLNQALTMEAEAVVRDSARVDALADVEVYRWDAGTAGLPLIGSKKGRIGVRARIMDPYTGRVYWSMNRLEKVKPGSDFLDRATLLFRDMVSDLGEKLDEVAEQRSEWENYEEQVAEGGDSHLAGKGQRKFTDAVRSDRGFVPVAPRRFGQEALKPVSARPVSQAETDEMALEETTESEPEADTQKADPRLMLPPLFAEGYEDVEEEIPAADLEQQRQEFLTPPVLRDRKSGERTSSMEPPMPKHFTEMGGVLPPLQTESAQGDSTSQSTNSPGNSGE